MISFLLKQKRSLSRPDRTRTFHAFFAVESGEAVDAKWLVFRALEKIYLGLTFISHQVCRAVGAAEALFVVVLLLESDPGLARNNALDTLDTLFAELLFKTLFAQRIVVIVFEKAQPFARFRIQVFLAVAAVEALAVKTLF